jgi:hypothetical protein
VCSATVVGQRFGDQRDRVSGRGRARKQWALSPLDAVPPSRGLFDTRQRVDRARRLSTSASVAALGRDGRDVGDRDGDKCACQNEVRDFQAYLQVLRESPLLESAAESVPGAMPDKLLEDNNLQFQAGLESTRGVVIPTLLVCHYYLNQRRPRSRATRSGSRTRLYLKRSSNALRGVVCRADPVSRSTVVFASNSSQVLKTSLGAIRAGTVFMHS